MLRNSGRAQVISVTCVARALTRTDSKQFPYLRTFFRAHHANVWLLITPGHPSVWEENISPLKTATLYVKNNFSSNFRLSGEIWPHTERRTQIEGAWELGAEEKTWNSEEVARGWRRLHNEELHNLYTSPNIMRGIKSRKMRWTARVARMGQMRNAYKVLVGKLERKRQLGRPRRWWEDNITMVRR
jgi:hypothetical protein